MMKRFTAAIFAVMFALTLSLTVSAATDISRIFLLDAANFLTDSEETRLADEMVEFSNYTGWNVGIVTTAHDLSDNAAIMISEDYYDNAFGINTDGVLLLMDSANGNYVLHVVAANSVRASISTKDAQNITDHIKTSFEKYDEYQTASLFLDYCKLYHDGGSLPKTSSSLNIELALVFFAFAVAAAIITGSVIWQRYNKHPKISAVAYLNQNTVNIYTRSDRFVREYTTRTRRSNSTGGGGGGHHGGGHHGGGGSRGHR
jgi:uncharacterized membrane protein YgcG